MSSPGNADAARVPMLDVLRGAAVLAVFVQHLGDRFRPFVLEQAADVLPGWVLGWLALALERGHWGVDLFFVLSGFTLGMGFVRDFDRGVARTAGGFFARRAARILPGFYVAVAVHILLNLTVLRAASAPQALASHALLLQGYWSPGAITLIGASWSLTTESHFYLAAPFAARWLLGPARTKAVPLLRAAWVLAAVCAGVWLVRGVLHDVALAPGSPAGMLELSQRRWALCRFDQFVLGLGAAVAHARLAGRLRAPRAAGWGLVVGAGLLLAAAVPLDALTWPRPGGHAAYALVSLAMTALVAGGALLTARVRVLEPLRALGVVSYGFFLYHQLAIAQLQRWVPGAACWSELAVTGLGALALASLAGAASWHLVESPSLKLVSGWLKGRGLRATTRTPACVEDIAAGGRGV